MGSSSSRKANIPTVRGASAAELADARTNRDPLTLISTTDRSRYAGKWVVVRHSGPTAGLIAGSDETMRGVRLIARTIPDYRPFDYRICYVPERDEPIVANQPSTQSASK